VESPLYTCKENEVSEGYTEAEIESPDGMVIAVKILPGYATRHTFFVPKGGCWSKEFPFLQSRDDVNWMAIASESLADIIVRGIRSLEEEKAGIMQRGEIRGRATSGQRRDLDALDRDTPEDPDWGWPGHGAG
jgi:hypothetical protein